MSDGKPRSTREVTERLRQLHECWNLLILDSQRSVFVVYLDLTPDLNLAIVDP
jgi:hypothetical protein